MRKFTEAVSYAESSREEFDALTEDAGSDRIKRWAAMSPLPTKNARGVVESVYKLPEGERALYRVCCTTC